MVFEKITPKAISEQVIQQIIEVIQSGQYEIGDRLPSERKLSDLMGVSRSTLREALVSLAVLGILEMKQGSGTFVRANSIDEKLAFKAASLLATEKSPMKALEARILFEPPIAALAAERAETKDLELMQSALDEIKNRVRQKRLFKSAGQKFFLSMIQSVNNPIVEHSAITAIAIWYSDIPGWDEIVASIVKGPGRMERYYNDLLNIYHDIKNRDSESAAEDTEKFLIGVQNDFFSDEGESKKAR